MNKKYLELKEKLLTDYELQKKKIFELAQKFTNPTDKVKSVLNDNLVNQFEETKDNITFGAFIKKQNSNYYVSMIIFDTDYTFSNLNAKTYNNLEEANTYFSSLKDLIKNNDLESLSASLLKVAKTKKTELLFLALFIRMLKIGGRCACIVPDGVLFGSSKAHKQIRKAIIEDNRLEAVISMPSGVFKPYAGVSTGILIFTKTGHGGTDKVWFYDMKADGYSLDDKRSPVKENDIPDIIERFNHLDKEENRKRTEQSFLVDMKEIVDNDYDLSINKYKEVIYEKVEYPPTSEILADIEELNKEIDKNLEELKALLKG